MKNIVIAFISLASFSAEANHHFICRHYKSDGETVAYVQQYVHTEKGQFEEFQGAFTGLKEIEPGVFQRSGLAGSLTINLNTLAGTHRLFGTDYQIRCEVLKTKNS